MPDTSTDAGEYDTSRLIQALYERWQALLDRYDARDTAATDPLARARVHLELESQAMMVCAIPAPTMAALRPKALVAAWARDNAVSWEPIMIEAALASDTLALQPEKVLAV